MAKPVPDPRIAEYIAEIEQPGIPYVSTSHNTLFRLGQQHGHELVQQLINAYFEEKRNAQS